MEPESTGPDPAPFAACPRCGHILQKEDVGRSSCSPCREGEQQRHQASMGPLACRADFVRRGKFEANEFFELVGPEIRHLACTLFGHPTFSLETWRRLVDWLSCEHGIKGPNEGRETSLPETPRAKVVELLGAELGRKRAGAAVDSTVPQATGPDDCPVILLGQDKGPLVLGREQKKLTPAQYPVVEALVLAYPRRLSLSQLHGEVKRLTGRRAAGSPHHRAGDLAKIPGALWSQVIIRPGRTGRDGYGIRCPTRTPSAINLP